MILTVANMDLIMTTYVIMMSLSLQYIIVSMNHVLQ